MVDRERRSLRRHQVRCGVLRLAHGRRRRRAAPALLAATGAALGLGTLGEAVDEAAAENAGTIGIVGVVALIVILFVAYFAGGYVAGRMARFNGMKQGIAVWLWAIVIAVVGAVIGGDRGSGVRILANLNTFPRIPVQRDLLVTGIVTLPSWSSRASAERSSAARPARGTTGR